MAIVIVAFIFFFIFLLIIGANMLLVSVRHLARVTHAGVFALSAILLGLATSFPELSVAITSGISGNSSLSLGNVLGANIANITLVSGAAAIIAGRVLVHGKIVNQELIIAFLAGLIPLAFLLDGSLSKVDGLILIFLYLLHALHFFHIKWKKVASEFVQHGLWHRFLHKVEVKSEGRELLHFLLGMVLLIFSANVIVRLSSALAVDADIPIFLVGAFVLSIGTTLPELAFSFKSIKSGEPRMFLGNILGSIIANSTLIVGLAALLSPIEIEQGKMIIFGLAFAVTYILFWIFIRTKEHLDRKEAATLLILYVVFVAIITR